MKIREQTSTATITRRDAVGGGVGLAFLATAAIQAAGNPTKSDDDSIHQDHGDRSMSKVGTKDTLRLQVSFLFPK
ncbi:MAG TPA: hypothetical protein VK660_09860 [Xanthomonadaceae bacterium]|nr:hypothetical protein [Xanthomonadaceae bacterium]